MDANLLIYLNTLEEGEDRARLVHFYSRLLQHDLYTDVLAIDETIYLSLSKFRVPYSLSFRFLKASVLPYSEVVPIEGSDLRVIERYLSNYAVRPSDSVHLAVMEKAGVTSIASEEGEFDRVKEVERIWLETPGFQQA